MKNADYLKLAERCERASGPDRELDLAIGLSALGWEWVEDEFVCNNQYLDYGAPNMVGIRDGEPLPDCVPAPTRSLDDAWRLIDPDKEWAGDQGSVLKYIGGKWAGSVTRIGGSFWCETPALALCAAALRARASSERTQETPK